jgi:starvation-inducible DNA-binding protein
MDKYYAPTDTSGGKRVLAEKLSVILADVVAYKAIAQGYHWNVKGPEFTQFHAFFQELYEDADSSVDPLAENVRKLGFDAPFTLEDFVSLNCLEVAPAGSDPITMCQRLYQINEHIRACLNAGFNIANDIGQQGIADFLAGRIDIHDKWLWQLGTITGVDSTQISVIEL